MTTTVTCKDLDRFVDGELGAVEARTFRDHLGVCRACPARLRATILADDVAQVALARRRSHTVEMDIQDVDEVDVDEAPIKWPVTAAERRPAGNRWWRRLSLAMATLICAAGATAGFVVVKRSLVTPDLLTILGQDKARSIEGRLTYPGMDRHRPLARERGGPATSHPGLTREQALARLEERDDRHGLGVVLLLEGRPARAEHLLGQARASAALDTDAAAAAIERGDAPTALTRAERALTSGPPLPQALWNRAVALAMLGRRGDAAEAFASVAVLGEPGWSDEARARQRALRDQVERRPAD